MKYIPANFIALVLTLCCSMLLFNFSFCVSSQESPITFNLKGSPTPTPEKKFVISDKSTPVVKPSNIMERVRAKFNESEKISAKQLADFANEILKKDGYDFTFDWTPKGKKNEANLAKSGEDYYPFYHVLIDGKGRKIAFQFMNADFGHPCFSVMDVPLTAVSQRKITIVSNGQKIDLMRPKDFVTEEMILTSKNLKKALRKWKTPIDATPVGISVDGTKIYFDTWLFYQDPNGNYAEKPIGIAIEMSQEGAIRFVDNKDIPSDEGIDIDHDKKFTEIIYRKYKVKGKEYIVKYSAPCT